jgi:anti-sigma28 factor (negative regulator of flagellin synthesis)
VSSSSKAKKSKKPKKSEEDRLEEIRQEIRNLPYLEDRVGQAFIMFGKMPKK